MSHLDLQLLRLCENVKYDTSSIEQCLNAGANVNCRCEMLGRTPLMIVIDRCILLENFEPTFVLIEQFNIFGADFNIPDKFGNTPLITAIRWSGKKYCRPYVVNELEYLIYTLLVHHADPNLADGFGNWPLTEALRLKRYPIISELIIEKEANVQCMNQHGDTPLHISLKLKQISRSDRNRHKDIQRMLISETKDINVRDRQGNTPLMLAVMNNADSDIVARLLEKSGVDTNVVNNEGVTPVMIYLAKLLKTDPSIIKYSLINGSTETNCDNKVKLFEILLQTRTTHIDYRKRYPMSWLYAFLSEYGALANVKDPKGLTLLHKAIYYLNVKAVKYLLESGADANIPYPQGDLPFLRLITDVQKARFKWSDVKDMFTILELLVIHGADTEAVIVSSHSAQVVDCLHWNDAAVHRVIHEVRDSDGRYMGNPWEGDGRWKGKAEGLATVFYYLMSRTGLEWENDVIPLTKCLLCVIVKPRSKSQFVLALQRNIKTLITIFIKTGAVPTFYKLPELVFNLGHLERTDMDNLMADFACRLFNCRLSPFLYSLCNYDLAISRMFLNCNFLNSVDINPPRDLKLEVAKRVEKNAEINQIFREFYCQPHSLTRLCFVQVSVCVGFDDKRDERISHTGLCLLFQRLLRFQSFP